MYEGRGTWAISVTSPQFYYKPKTAHKTKTMSFERERVINADQ